MRLIIRDKTLIGKVEDDTARIEPGNDVYVIDLNDESVAQYLIDNNISESADFA